LFLVVSISVIDCRERLVSKMTFCVEWDTVFVQSLTRPVQTEYIKTLTMLGLAFTSGADSLSCHLPYQCLGGSDY